MWNLQSVEETVIANRIENATKVADSCLRVQGSGSISYHDFYHVFQAEACIMCETGLAVDWRDLEEKKAYLQQREMYYVWRPRSQNAAL